MTPLYPNPIKRLRIKHNMTQAGFAELAGMSPTALLRYEQGIYETPSEKIVNAFHSLNDDDSDDPFLLSVQYHNWRMEVQKEASKYVNPLPSLAVLKDEHPFTTFRKAITTSAVGKDSRMSFCILLAIHPSVVLDYEKCKQPHMPALIHSALSNAGINEEYINSLDQLGVVYYERRNN